ncbi:hypothetical protein HHK36_013182 [Tetracentron sinense]|uniref:Uncharacterized protein n=1 Tax=Tetracentron sinense TaxID=13715 RepID=A0A834Z897_TETSI|nr:hypothetical protein HHK36_013182 [Tetracentron sinense]
MFPSSNSEASLLSFKRKDLTWVCPQAADVVELFIYLGEPCHVCQLLLTISHGADDSTFPGTVDVRTGCNLDGLKLVLEFTLLQESPVSPEDMAVTRAGGRCHAQDTSSLLLLYDFEELEGELDFLTRVVALTFYPVVSGRTPITLGEIEVLGVSLPWSDIFTKRGPGVKFCEHVNKSQKEANPFLSGLDTNPFVDSIAQPARENVGSGGGDLLDFLDDAVVEYRAPEEDSKFSSSSQDGRPTGNGVQHYINFVKALTGPYMERKLNFIEAMKLEIERLWLNLSAAERDRALLSIGTDPATINPNGLLVDSYMGRLCRLANTLALLGQAALEDKVTAAIGLGTVDDDEVIDFWNITGIGETHGMCGVRAETEPPGHVSCMVSSAKALPSVLFCSHCERKVCCGGRGVLAGYNSRELASSNGLSSHSGSSHGSQTNGFFTNRSVTLNGVICTSCGPEIVLDALILDYVRVLISLRRSACADSAAHKALDQVIGFPSWACLTEINRTYDSQRTVEILRELFNGEESLAEFPFACLLHSVETATGSAPSLSLLAPFDSESQHSYWRAPPSTSCVEFAIAFGCLSDVSGVILLVSPWGYSMADTPTVHI